MFSHKANKLHREAQNSSRFRAHDLRREIFPVEITPCNFILMHQPTHGRKEPAMSFHAPSPRKDSSGLCRCRICGMLMAERRRLCEICTGRAAARYPRHLRHVILTAAIILLLALIWIAAAWAEEKDAFKWRASLDGDKAAVSVEVPALHLLYAGSTSVSFRDADLKMIDPETVPATSKHKDGEEESEVYAAGIHKWVFPASGKPPFKVSVKYQGCSTKPYLCFPPAEQEIAVEGGGAGRTIDSTEKPDAARPERPADKSAAKDTQAMDVGKAAEANGKRRGFIGALIAEGGLLLFVGAFIGGLLSTLTPCVLPLIPVTLAILGADASSGRDKALRRSCLYVFGIVVMFTALASAAALSGKAFGGQILGNSFAMLIFALFFFALSLSMLGLYEIALPQKLQMRLNSVGGGSDAGAFLMGLAAGFIAVPCTGPVLAVLLGLATLSGSPMFSIPLMASYALGFGMPFLLLGVFAVKMPRSGPIMNAAKSLIGIAIMTIAGFALVIAVPSLKHLILGVSSFSSMLGPAMILLGIAMGAIHLDGHSPRICVKAFKVIGALLVSAGILSAMEYRAQARDAASIAWNSSLEDALRISQNAGKPLMLDFTADWCAACKEMDATTFRDARVVSEIAANWIPARIDATRNSPELDSILGRFKVQGFPTVVLISPSGKILDKMTGYMAPEELLAKMSSQKTTGRLKPN